MRILCENEREKKKFLILRVNRILFSLYYLAFFYLFAGNNKNYKQ